MYVAWCLRSRLHEQHPQDDPDVLPRLRPDRQALCSRILQKLAGVPASGVNPPAPHPGVAGVGVRTSGGWPNSWRCKGWAGPFPWFEYHLNQTNHAH